MLHKVKGPTCFKDLRTVNKLEHAPYYHAGLLVNDNKWYFEVRRENPQMTLEFTNKICNEAHTIEDRVLEMTEQSWSEVGLISPLRKQVTIIPREICRELSYDCKQMHDYVAQNEPLQTTEQ